MTAAASTRAALARKLRDLRLEHWPGRRLTQRELAVALGGDRGPLSTPLISSWESVDKPVVPPEHWLEPLARLYATQRSLEPEPHLVDENDLTAEERRRRDELLRQLLDLRQPDTASARPFRIPLNAPHDEIGGGLWFYQDGRPVTIVCARLPSHLIERMPYTDPRDPDFVRLYTYADLDALLELHGHVRAVNPASRVHIRTPQDLEADDLTTHLVLLGGVDWNALTRDVSRMTYVPVRQRSRVGKGTAYDEYFEVGEGSQVREVRPTLEAREDGGVTLREDVCHFFRGTNPFNIRRSVTICNGMFGRGVYGAVRALTDARFRDRNEVYISERFHGSPTFSIVSRVLIVRGETVTPDWTIAENRLHEWPENAG